jgi:putative transposase
VKYACIARHRGEFRLRLMCRVLAVSVSGFYAAQRRAPSARAQTDRQLQLAIRVAHAESEARYGAPRVHRELHAAGLRVSRKRVARLMREAGLVARRRRRYRSTTDSGHRQPVAANVLRRTFSVTAIGGPNRVWASDLTALPTGEGWLYLAAVLDLGSRRVVGWAVAPRLELSLPLTALEQAFARRRPPAGLLHHSDQGAQFTSGAYQALLAAHSARASMSRRGNCWDNAVVESFFATLKAELLPAGPRGRTPWRTRSAATTALVRYIDGWYNPVRRHSTLGYLSPVAYEQHHRGSTAA